MKIISWNVRISNPLYKRLLKYVLSSESEIICLQEVNIRMADYLSNVLGREITTTCEMQGKREKKSMYLVTTVAGKITKHEDYIYHDEALPSLWAMINYRLLGKKEEMHTANITEAEIGSKLFRIINCRLSAATGPLARLSFVQNLLSQCLEDRTNVICGDFNLGGNTIWNIFSGWLRGYKFKEIFINEQLEFLKLFKKYKLLNPFENHHTTKYPHFIKQLDHILVPENIKVVKKTLHKKTFTSDHKMLEVEIA